MIPVIGISAEVDDEKDIKLKNTYVHAIEESGGIPIVLPYTRDLNLIEYYAEMCDGFLFTGGDDIEPSRYGAQRKEACGEIQRFRDDFEFNMLDRVIKSEKPLLAICRGIQLVNVAFGGTLYQDITDEKPSDTVHRQNDFGATPIHSVRIVPDSPLNSLVKQELLKVNSLHHQAIKTLGDRLEVMATADDGIVEAVCLPGYGYLRAYQWHPERMFDNDMPSRLIFADFINACGSDSNLK